MPRAGPTTGCPRYCTSPALGSARPAISRSSVDLPDPERPSSPMICPSRSSRFIPSSTKSSSPSGFGNALRTWLHWSNGLLIMMCVLSGHPIFALGVVIQGPPEEPVDDHHEQAHHAHAENDLVEVAHRRRIRDVGAKSFGADFRVSPGHQLGDLGGVPRAARCRDRTGD